MRKTAKHLLIIALALLALALALCWRNWRRHAGDAALVRWDSGELTVSEEAYYGDRVHGIIGAWMRMGQDAERDEEGRPREPYHTFLVLDASRREIWIEDRGQVLQEYRSELPARMTWTVYHDVGNGANRLGNVARLRYRGNELDRHYPEIVWLTGKGIGEYLAFHFTDHDLGRTHLQGGNVFAPYHRPQPQKPGVQYYGSILVVDAEYEQARLSWNDASKGIMPAGRLLATDVGENKAAWAKVEKKLYQAIEGQVNRTGYDLRHLQVRPGPDYSAAHARIQAAKDGILVNLLGRAVLLDPYLWIDYLGSDVWYAKIAPNPQPLAPLRNRLDPVKELPLEFLVSADQAIPSSARRAWIEKGRTRQEESADAQSKWTATLGNGAVVRFLGICEHPSAGKRWWGPDGSTIDYVPCFPWNADGRNVARRRSFEFAWCIQHPEIDKPQGLSAQHHFEDGAIFSSGSCCDRYGIAPLGGRHESGIFEESQEKATLTIGTNLNNEGFHAVRFKNLSLVPGKNQGFEIEVVK